MSKILFSLAIASTAFVACLGGGHESPAEGLSCDPPIVSSIDTLTLRFADPHPKELAIRGPDDTWFFLVYEPSEELSPGLRPIMDKTSFGRLKTLSLPVASASGSPWTAGRDNNERIFQQAGEYEVVLTAALECEDIDPTFRCKVRFRP